MLKKKKYAKNQLDDQGPDWGELKPFEVEQPPVLKKTEKVTTNWVRVSARNFSKTCS